MRPRYLLTKARVIHVETNPIHNQIKDLSERTDVLRVSLTMPSVKIG